ncbi:MAG: GntR family transcriptional regulator [Lautropia sp.]
MPKTDLPTLLRESALGEPTGGTKHAQLSALLRHAIASGMVATGDRLPTEAEFVASTPYSLGTVQRAIRTLVEEGLVERKPKLGTFVAERRRIEEPWHFRFLDADRRSLLPVYPTVVGRSHVRQRGPWSDYLAGPLLRIDRVVNVNDAFDAFSRFYVERRRFPLLEEAALESLHGRNFRAFLNTQLDRPILRFCHRVFLQRVAADIAQAIDIAAGEPCTHVEIAASAGGDDFVYFQELILPGTGTRLELVESVAPPLSRAPRDPVQP